MDKATQIDRNQEPLAQAYEIYQQWEVGTITFGELYNALVELLGSQDAIGYLAVKDMENHVGQES